jgi:hypothetical protein
MSITINPILTNNAAGSFGVDWTGYIQGLAMDSPNVRYSLKGGVVASTETLPMWGGIGVAAYVPGATGGPNKQLGLPLARATSLASTVPLLGFTVMDQAHGMVQSPENPVPVASAGMSVNFYQIGSGARIPVAADPSLASSIVGGLINQQVSWDFNNQILQAYDASTPTYSLTSISNVGAVVAAVATPVAGVGDYVNISGATTSGGTGGTGAANLYVNGNRLVTAFTDNQHFTVALGSTAAVIGTIGGTLLLNYGTGALNVDILDANVGNSMTVAYNAFTGLATWNRSGSCVLIEI